LKIHIIVKGEDGHEISSTEIDLESFRKNNGCRIAIGEGNKQVHTAIR